MQFEKVEIEVMKELGIELKNDYSDNELVDITDKISDALVLEFDEDYKPTDKAIVMEGILDKLSEVE